MAFTRHTDGEGHTIYAAHINELQVAIEGHDAALDDKADSTDVSALTPGSGKTIIGGANGAVAAVNASPFASLLPIAMSEAKVSLAVQVLGDSTGNSETEWVHLMGQDIASIFPGYEVRHYLWNANTQHIPVTPLVIQSPSVPRHIPLPGIPNQNPWYTAPAITGNLDVRMKVECDAWGVSQATLAHTFGDSGDRGWRFGVSDNGYLTLDWSEDGTNLESMAYSDSQMTASGPIWVRVTLDVDSGNNEHTVTFYTSADGETWTSIGAVTRSGVTEIFASTEPIGIGSRGAIEMFTGKLFEAHICDGIDGPLVAPALPEHWQGYSNVPDVVGTPILSLVNGSHPGANIAYLADPTRLKAMTPNYGQVIGVISSSHNESRNTGSAVINPMKSYLADVRTRLPGITIAGLTQNPRVGTDLDMAQARRRLDYIAGSQFLSWSAIDTYGAFLADPRGVSALVNNDGLHPNADGEQLWADTVRAALGLA